MKISEAAFSAMPILNGAHQEANKTPDEPMGAGELFTPEGEGMGYVTPENPPIDEVGFVTPDQPIIQPNSPPAIRLRSQGSRTPLNGLNPQERAAAAAVRSSLYFGPNDDPLSVRLFTGSPE